MNLQPRTKLLVVCAVNFTEGGPLTILRDCLHTASASLPKDWEIVALVHNAKLISLPRVKVLTFSSAKGSWLKRLYLEWFGFKRYFRNTHIDLWLSLHDVTPRVSARRQVVYCHNPSPFYKISLREARLEPKFLLFNFFYAYLYRFFIRRNYFIVVQQDWLRDAFNHHFGILPIIVAHPDTHIKSQFSIGHLTNSNAKNSFILLYPTLPRVFKNIETVMEAIQILTKSGQTCFQLRVTISGFENPYSQWLYKRFSETPGICFIGRQDSSNMAKQYQEADAVVFPSKLETWGLPISEAKSLRKPLLVADLPYARETVGDYDNATFISAIDSNAWARSIEDLIRGDLVKTPVSRKFITEPFAPSWDSLWTLLIKDL